jgi:hypothetical protein
MSMSGLTILHPCFLSRTKKKKEKSAMNKDKIAYLKYAYSSLN